MPRRVYKTIKFVKSNVAIGDETTAGIYFYKMCKKST